jgi:hypothetical protein
MRRREALPTGSAGVSARRSSTGWPGRGTVAGAPDPPGSGERWFAEEAAMAAEMERDLIRERTLDGLRVAQVQGRRGGRPAAVNDDVLAIARARRERGDSVTAIARHLGIGRSTLYLALDLEHDAAASQETGGVPVTAPRVRGLGIGVPVTTEPPAPLRRPVF